jgi:hypothetical protein
MRLFVDDTRELPKHGYQCARDADTAIKLLSLLKFEHISLDYSLGTDRKTGLDILVWMKDNNIFVPEINIHSNHIFGIEKMEAFCKENFPNSKVTTITLPK